MSGVDMSELVGNKKVSEMTDAERRSAECFFAKQAIRSAMLPWGPGWAHLTPEVRKALLLLAIVEYMSGQCWCGEAGLACQRGVGWTAEDCWRVLEICKHPWSNGEYGLEMARMAL